MVPQLTEVMQSLFLWDPQSDQDEMDLVKEDWLGSSRLTLLAYVVVHPNK